MRKNLFLLVSISIVFTTGIVVFSCNPAKTVSNNAALIHTTDPGKTYFLFLSDVHLAANTTTTNYGDDAGTALWDTFKLKINSFVNSLNPPSFILYTGDMPEHGGNNNPDQRNKNITNVLTDLHQISAVKNIPLFYLPGNNDALGGNYCFFSDDNGKTPFSLIQQYSPYPYQPFNVSKTPVANGAYMMSDANLASGYYSAKINKGLRMISLNTVIWSSQLCANCAENTDCQLQQNTGEQQMKWLQQQLKNAADSNDKVYIAMHIPPGDDAYLSRNDPSNPVAMWQNPVNWQNQFLKAISQYKQTVAGVFYGHTHMDEFRMLYGDSLNNTISQVAISCPGISARSGNNPGFKLVTVDEATKFPTDFITYYASLQPIQWQQPYQFSKLSGSALNASIYEVLTQMKPDERKKLLNSTYTVKHGSPKSFFSLGLDVKWVK